MGLNDVFSAARERITTAIDWRRPVIWILAVTTLAGSLSASTDFTLLGVASVALSLAIGSLIFFFHFFVTGRAIKRRLFNTILIATFLFITYLWSSLSVGDSGLIKGYYVASLILAVGALYGGICVWTWTKADLGTLGVAFSSLIFGLASSWALHGFPFPFMAYFANPNSMGGFIAFGLFFVIALFHSAAGPFYRSVIGGVIMLSCVLVISTDSRTSVMSLATAAFAYALWPWLTRSRLLYLIALPFLFVTIASFVYIYADPHSIFVNYQALVQEYTGKPVTSGRERIWPDIVAAILEKPYLGSGAGIHPSNYIIAYAGMYELSAHNLFLQIALQTGFLGLGLFLLLIWTVWLSFWPGRRDSIVRLCGAFTLAVVVHQTFEVSLTENAVYLGVLQWLIMGIGSSRAGAIQGDSR